MKFCLNLLVIVLFFLPLCVCLTHLAVVLPSVTAAPLLFAISLFQQPALVLTPHEAFSFFFSIIDFLFVRNGHTVSVSV